MQNSSKKLRLGVIGLGVMGKNHLRVLGLIPSAEVVGLCDNAMDAYEGHKVYRQVDTFLDEVTMDAAIIAVPTFLHRDIALKCMERGIHLFIEKPVASTVEEARSLASAVPAGIKTVVGHVERSNPVVKSLKKELDGKEIYSVAITRVGPFPPRIADVGILTDLAVHDVDLIRYITQREVISRHIFSSQKIHDHHEDNAILSFELEGDTIASIITNWLTPYKKRKIEVATAEGYFEADLINQQLKEFSSYRTNHSYLVRDCIVFKGEPLRHELEDFCDYCLHDKVSPNLASIEDSIRTLELVAR
ncbi:Gfo/Idh/MocA family protein [Desulfurispira natronophila]|uniref:Putative dehydrogenase n=1 Tax=Desulfurispira natronophila TaxID=682562 RepID=A0A7W7Y4T8_9BACT|nr:Gfo/Idh/MocA family oxidoreductase [Desulfurispira natronophila]MBB5022108.1 putative dehydrogenase [Desulfurispira natronophila]